MQTLHINAPGPAYRQNIVFNAAGTLAYTANISSGEVSVINATNKSLIAQVITGEGANVVALSPDESRLFVSASYPSSAIYVVNTSNLVVEESHETEPGLPPESIAITDDGQWVVGDDHGSGAIFFGTVAGGAAIANTIFAPNGGSYYTSTSNFVSPKLVNVLGISTTATFSTANYSVPNTGFDH